MIAFKQLVLAIEGGPIVASVKQLVTTPLSSSLVIETSRQLATDQKQPCFPQQQPCFLQRQLCFHRSSLRPLQPH